MTVGLVIAGTVAVRAGAGSTATDGGQALVRIDTRARAVSLASTTLAPADHFVLLTHSRLVPLLPGSAPESVLPGESYAAIVLARDGVGAECVPIVRDDRFLQSGDVVLPSPPPSQVTLQFVGLGGKPLPGVSLAARLEGAPDVDVTALLCPVSVADKNGDLACAVPPGTLLTAVAGTQSRVIDLAARATSAGQLRVVMPATRLDLALRKEAPDGGGIADAKVDAHWTGGSPQDTSFVKAQSDTTGHAFVFVPRDREVTVRAVAKGFLDAKRSLSAGDDRITLELDMPAEAVVAGRARTARGTSVADVDLHLTCAPADEQVIRAHADGSGSWRVDRLAAGRCALALSVPGSEEREPTVIGTFELRKGAVTDVGTVEVRGGPTLRGVVHDSSGNAIEGASVLLSCQGCSGCANGRVAMTAADGTFELDCARADSSVEVTHPEHPRVRASVGDVELTSGLDVTLPDGGSIDGLVLDSEGAPLAGEDVQLGGDGLTTKRVRSDDSGKFHIGGVPAGPRELRWNGTTYPLDVSENRASYIELRRRAGRILVSVSGSSIGSGTAQLCAYSGGRFVPMSRLNMSSTTPAIFEGVEPGQYCAVIFAACGWNITGTNLREGTIQVWSNVISHLEGRDDTITLPTEPVEVPVVVQNCSASDDSYSVVGTQLVSLSGGAPITVEAPGTTVRMDIQCTGPATLTLPAGVLWTFRGESKGGRVVTGNVLAAPGATLALRQ